MENDQRDIKCSEYVHLLQNKSCALLQIVNDPLLLKQKAGNLVKFLNSNICAMFLNFGLERKENLGQMWMYSVSGFLGQESEFTIMGKDVKTQYEFSTM